MFNTLEVQGRKLRSVSDFGAPGADFDECFTLWGAEPDLLSQKGMMLTNASYVWGCRPRSIEICYEFHTERQAERERERERERQTDRQTDRQSSQRCAASSQEPASSQQAASRKQQQQQQHDIGGFAGVGVRSRSMFLGRKWCIQQQKVGESIENDGK